MADELDLVEFSYIVNALELAPDFRFVSEEIEECAFFLANSEAGGAADRDTIAGVLRILREHAA